MKAMVFAAGLGTRLRPLTDTRPKAMVEVAGVSLIERALQRCVEGGVTEVMVNVHHHADMLEDFLLSRDFGLKIHISDERDELLETGGGLMKVADFFSGEKAFWTINADVISDADMRAIFADHRLSGAYATMAVMERPSSRSLLFNDDMQLCGWLNEKTNQVLFSRTNERNLQPLAFSGVQVLSPDIFKYFPEKVEKFSIIDLILTASQYHDVRAYDHTGGLWFDCGTVESIAAAEKVLMPG